MAQPEQPHAPESLPKYLAEGMAKQDNDTLDDVIEYAEALIEHNNRPIEDDLPEDVESVENDSDNKGGTLVLEKVKCGKDDCKCADGEKHGPYYYRYFRDESGTLTSEYEGKPD